MENANKYYNSFKKDKLLANLKQSYATSLKNENFAKTIKKFKIKESIAIKYTSKLETTSEELLHCAHCKGLAMCKNKVDGYIYCPEVRENELLFSYIPCKYQQDFLKKENQKEFEKRNIPIEIKNASMKDIDTTDKKRHDAIKKLKSFLDNYGKEKYTKGLFLHGSFGSGKTYLIAATLNELSKKGINVVIIYLANFLRILKEAMDGYGFKDKMDEVLSAEILLIDDMGAEALSAWSRDEIIGAILQHRMDNNLTTFITSNLNIEELESHLSFTKGKDDKVKARRIIERIKYLTDDVELISKNRRE